MTRLATTRRGFLISAGAIGIAAPAVSAGWARAGGLLLEIEIGPDDLERPVRFVLGETRDVRIAWGDGRTERIADGVLRETGHVYAQPGSYRVCIRGEARSFYSREAQRLVGVPSFGDLGIVSISGAFNAHRRLRVVGRLPRSVVNLALTFYAGAMPSGLEAWNVDNVISFARMFSGARGNRDLSSWRPIRAVELSEMFRGCVDFDAPLGSWGEHVARVGSFRGMFQGARAFNQPLPSWDVRNAGLNPACRHAGRPLENMFAGASAFAQDLSGWHVRPDQTRPDGFSGPRGRIVEPPWGTGAPLAV